MALLVVMAGVLLHSMNVLLTTTVLPSIVAELGGAALVSWPTTAFLASSIIAATVTGRAVAIAGPRMAYAAGAAAFALGAAICAVATDMGIVVFGRFVQGLGGGMLNALAYVLVRSLLPERLWARAFAAIATVWGVSVVIGPLVGGLFAAGGVWRGAFVAVGAGAALLLALSLKVLGGSSPAGGPPSRLPLLRVGLACGAIAVLSAAAVVQAVAWKAALISAALAGLVAVLRIDRRAEHALLPSDAFSIRTGTGIGLWIVLLASLAYNPFPVFGTILLQRLHGFGPLEAGYMVAISSLAWTFAAIATASLAIAWHGRVIVAGPAVMAVGLLAIAIVLPRGPIAALPLPIALVGLGIGACWAFLAQAVMRDARPGEQDTAASAVATVQQLGLAIGAALSGLIANAAGFADPGPVALASAAFWVPAGSVAFALAGSLMGLRLKALVG